MRRNALQLSRRHKAALYATLLLLFASGAAWPLLDRFATVQDEFGGLAKHPAQAWTLTLHGAAAALTLLLLGTLLPIHIKRGWQARWNLPSGLALSASLAILTLSGYALYYLGGETKRAVSSNIHLWLGLALPALLLWHIARGHYLRRHGRLRHPVRHA